MKLMSSALHEYITNVDQESNYDIGSCDHMEIVSGPTNLSRNSSG